MDYYWTVNIDKILKVLERLSPFWILYLHLNGWSRKIACLKIFKKYCNEKFCSFNVSTFCCSKNFSLLGFEPYSMRLNFKKCHFKFSKKNSLKNTAQMPKIKYFRLIGHYGSFWRQKPVVWIHSSSIFCSIYWSGSL